MQQQINGLIQAPGPDDLTRVDKKYLVGIFYRIQPVGDNDACRRLRQLPENVFQHLFRDRVDIGGSFIEDQQLRITQDHPDKGNQLFLSEADAVARRNDLGIQTLVKTRQQSLQIGPAKDIGQLVIRTIHVLLVTIKN